MTNRINVYSRQTVAATASEKARFICKRIIGPLNRLIAMQYRKGIIDPRNRERLSKAFRDLNRWRAIGKWVVTNMTKYARVGLKYLDGMLGMNAARSVGEPEDMATFDSIMGALLSPA